MELRKTVFAGAFLAAAFMPQSAGATTYTGTFGYSGTMQDYVNVLIEDFDFSGTFQISFELPPVGYGFGNQTPDAFALTIGTASFDASNTLFSVGRAGASAPDIYRFFFGGITGGVGGGLSTTNPVPDFRFQVEYNIVTGALGSSFVGVSRPLDSPEGPFVGGASLGTFSFSISPNPGAVPEPATWLLMIGGFAAVGASLRARAAKPATI